MPCSRRSRGMFGFRSRCGSACGCTLQQIVDPSTGWLWTFYGKASTGGMERPTNNPQPPEDPMAQWITDRLPTVADADEDGDVTIPCPPGITSTRCIQHAYKYVCFARVLAGQPWYPALSSLARKSANQPVADPAPAPEEADPVEQAAMERYRAETALIQARTTMILAKAKAIAFPPYPPQSGAIQPPMVPGQPVPEGGILSGTRYASDAECKVRPGSPMFQRDER
jgi:hypothetical protein